MRLTVLGSGDAFGSGGRNFPSFLLSKGDQHLLMDCGPSALPAIKTLGVSPGEILGILISHFHGDHMGGVPFFFLEYQFLCERSGPLLIVGPTGARERCQALLQATYPDLVARFPQWRFAVEYREIPPQGIVQEGELRVEAMEMAHGRMAGALGYRIQWGGVVVSYTGDTRWNDRIPALAKGSDLFLCECAFFDQEQPAHMRYLDLVEHRAEIQSRRTVLFHLGPEMLDRAPLIDIEIARDGMIIDLEA